MHTQKPVGWNFQNSYATLPTMFFTKVLPTPVVSPKIVVFNNALAISLGLDADELQNDQDVFAGNTIPQDAQPLAQAYAGHQFGHFNMLGDGRAILLGEHKIPDGTYVDIQLKGSGRTPYSRGGDGRAALGPMLREYIISEAMHALGIPTTRSLAVVTTGEPVYRETILPGAIMTRIAASHLRVGTFQYAANWGDVAQLQTLADYAIARHMPEILKEPNRYLLLLHEVMKRQAALIAKWQLVGFIHGVMNTDNMTISGETIDYGPCAFMDTYDEATVFSSIDTRGRYAYGNQPHIGGWNVTRFAETLLPLLHESEQEAIQLAQEAIEQYAPLYERYWLAGMRAKLGLYNEEQEDTVLMDELLQIMQTYKADYTNTFVALTLRHIDSTKLSTIREFTQWHEKWQARLLRQPQSQQFVQQIMRNSNPSIIPRNHRVEEAIEAIVERHDDRIMQRLLEALAQPFAYTALQESYRTLPEKRDIPYRTFCGT